MSLKAPRGLVISCVLYFFMWVTGFSPFLAAYGVKKNNPIQVFLQRFFFFSVNSGTTNTGRLLVVMELGNTSVGDRDSCRTPRCAFLFAEAQCARMWGLSCCYEPLCSLSQTRCIYTKGIYWRCAHVATSRPSS